jgi:hypothetical protein
MINISLKEISKGTFLQNFNQIILNLLDVEAVKAETPLIEDIRDEWKNGRKKMKLLVVAVMAMVGHVVSLYLLEHGQVVTGV